MQTPAAMMQLAITFMLSPTVLPLWLLILFLESGRLAISRVRNKIPMAGK